MPRPSTSLPPQSTGLYPGDGVNEFAPTVSTGFASSIGAGTATLNGTINPNGLQTHYRFDYGRSRIYGTFAPTSPDYVIGGSAAVAVSAPLVVESFTPIHSYHFRLVGWNSAGTTYGADVEFNTAEPSYGPHDQRRFSRVDDAGRGQ